MTTPMSIPAPDAARSPTLRIGILRLTDCAPIVIAREFGFFDEAGLDVDLRVEPSWANIADRIAYGGLDAAMILPPLALTIALGLRGAPAAIAIPMGLSIGGNALTLSAPLAQRLAGASDAADIGRRMAALIAGGTRLRLAVVHRYSTHNLLLRHWLADSRIDVGNAVELVVVPPADTIDALRERLIDGFCAGAPWGAVAEAAGVGRTVLTGSAIWPGHPEKALAVSAALASGADPRLPALLAALLRSMEFCADPAHGDEIAAILGEPAYLHLPPEIIRRSLPGGSGVGVDLSDFAPAVAALPQYEHGAWFLNRMRRWGYLGGTVPGNVVTRVYRPDLIGPVAAELGMVLGNASAPSPLGG